MRRLITTCLLLFFAIGPLSAAFQPTEDLRLPACCRRHGAHHCNMPDSAAAQIAAVTGVAVMHASLQCSQFPKTGFAVNSSSPLFLASTSSLADLLAQNHSPAAALASARISRQRTRADRGPPAARIA